MRKKTRPALDVAAVEAAWDAFFKEEHSISKEQLEKEGWKAQKDLYASGVSWRTINGALNSGRLEKKKFKTNLGDRIRSHTFYRPKI